MRVTLGQNRKLNNIRKLIAIVIFIFCISQICLLFQGCLSESIDPDEIKDVALYSVDFFMLKESVITAARKGKVILIINNFSNQDIGTDKSNIVIIQHVYIRKLDKKQGNANIAINWAGEKRTSYLI